MQHRVSRTSGMQARFTSPCANTFRSFAPTYINNAKNNLLGEKNYL
jgi:hypothetical protein